MNRGMRVFRWGVLLWKRLYKKLTFLVLVAMIPVLVFGYGLVSQEESGIVTIALATEAGSIEPLTQTVWDTLQESNVMRTVICDSPEAAADMVKAGTADTAWIFAENLEEKIYDFAAHRSRKNAFITILEPEDRVALKLVREVISGVMFPHCSEVLYLQYIRENAPELAEVSDERLLEYYRSLEFTEELFVFTDLEGNVTEQGQTDYLLTPLRGLLAVVIVFAGFAAAMYYIRDTQNGTFAWIPQHLQGAVELGCQLISVVNITLVALLSLGLAGQTVTLGRELVVAVLYSLCAASFAMLVRRLTGGIRGLGMAAPLLAVVMMVVCPVFFDLGAIRQLQILLPPTYFINAAYNSKYIWWMAGYTLIMWLACFCLDRIKKRY